MRIVQLSTALPEEEYSTRDLLVAFPCALPDGVEQNVLNLGVSTRHLIRQTGSSKQETVMDEKPFLDLCKEACQNAIQEAEFSARSIGCLIAAYDVNPFLSPGLSQLLIPKLGLDPGVRHINAQGIASTAFIKALELAQDYIVAHPQEKVLICVSGVSSYWFQNQVQGLSEVMEIGKLNEIADRARRELELRKWVATMQYFLFGDGVAAAVVSESGKGIRIEKIAEVTNLEEKDYLAGYARLTCLGEPFKFGLYSHLDKEIPKLGVKYTGLALERLFEKNVAKMKKVKKWAVHTGSQKILDALADHHSIHNRKIRESHEVLKDFGNLAGASLPFILKKILSATRLSEGDNVVMLGYGWGFSASACLLET
jgi:3-oxoacyl-[acyl-carrier-protein] synthase III